MCIAEHHTVIMMRHTQCHTVSFSPSRTNRDMHLYIYGKISSLVRQNLLRQTARKLNGYAPNDRTRISSSIHVSEYPTFLVASRETIHHCLYRVGFVEFFVCHLIIESRNLYGILTNFRNIPKIFRRLEITQEIYKLQLQQLGLKQSKHIGQS